MMLAVQREQDEGPRGSNRLPASCDIVRMPCRTWRWSRQGKPETLGVRANLMKLVAVTQWVRAQAQVPPDQSLASRSGVTFTCTPSNGRTELDGTRRQAA
jgi:hypothetical protein